MAMQPAGKRWAKPRDYSEAYRACHDMVKTGWQKALFVCLQSNILIPDGKS